MRVQKKYSRLVNFLTAFDNFKDAEELVEISGEKYNKLQEFAQAFSAEINTSFKIKLTSENDFEATNYGVSGDTFDYGWYTNGTTRLGIPTSRIGTTDNPIMFKHFYWRNNYTANGERETINGVDCVAYKQWTTRGIGFENLIINSDVPVFFGYHAWSNGNWSNTKVWINNPNHRQSYYELFGDEQPKYIGLIEDYNRAYRSIANWWLTY